MKKGNPIGWCTRTLNPVVGCAKCSPGCEHCYAETMAVRLAAMEIEKYQIVTGPKLGGGNGWNGNCYFDESTLEKPFHWKSPETIFVCSMGDLFHENVPFEWVDRVMAVIALNSHHKFIILTKRPERMREYFYTPGTCILVGIRQQIEKMGYPDIGAVGKVLPNLALGVTAENQEMADLRIPILLQIPAAVRFVSIEPMLSKIDFLHYKNVLGNYAINVFHDWLTGETGGNGKTYKEKENKLDWVICGGENGHGARPMEPEWVRNVRDDCQDARVPFFFKGWGEWLPDDQIDCNKFVYRKSHPGAPSWAIDKPCTHLSPGLHAFKVGSKKSGHLIDGVEYRQRPAGW